MEPARCLVRGSRLRLAGFSDRGRLGGPAAAPRRLATLARRRAPRRPARPGEGGPADGSPRHPVLVGLIQGHGRSRRWQQALGVVGQMRIDSLTPTVVVSSAAISACERGQQWAQALQTFRDIRTFALKPDVVAFNATISACEKGHQWQMSLALLQEAESTAVFPDVVSHNAAISACAGGHEWAQALWLLPAMRSREIDPNVVSYNAALRACQKAQLWGESLSLLAEMGAVQQRPDVVSYSTAMSACERSRRWTVALRLLDGMVDARAQPNLIAYLTAMSAWSVGRHWQPALELLERTRQLSPAEPGRSQSREAGTLVVELVLGAGRAAEALALYREALQGGLLWPWHAREAGVMDFHSFSREVAEVATYDVLLRRLLHADDCREDLVVVTGRGEVRGNLGRSSLQPVLIEALRDELGLDVAVDAENPGRLRVTAASLQRLAEAWGCQVA